PEFAKPIRSSRIQRGQSLWWHRLRRTEYAAPGICTAGIQTIRCYGGTKELQACHSSTTRLRTIVQWATAHGYKPLVSINWIAPSIGAGKLPALPVRERGMPWFIILLRLDLRKIADFAIMRAVANAVHHVHSQRLALHVKLVRLPMLVEPGSIMLHRAGFCLT